MLIYITAALLLPRKLPFTHCVKSVQIRNFFWSVFFRIRTEYGNAGKYGPEKTPYLDTFHTVTLNRH